MKRSFFSPLYPIIIAISTLALSACEKTPVNGDLDGKWSLKELYTRSADGTGSYVAQTDTLMSPTYWSFQLNMMQINTAEALADGLSLTLDGYFATSDGKLSITTLYDNNRAAGHDDVIPDSVQLLRVGIRAIPANFRIHELSSKRMVLVGNCDSLVFKKMQ